MFKSWCRSNTCRMPVSLSEWRVRIGTYVPRMSLLKTVADGESNVDPSEKQEMGPRATTNHQSSTDKTPSKPEKGKSSCGCSVESETLDQTNSRPFSKKRKRHNRKGSDTFGRSSGAILSFRCFMKSGASPLLRFMLLVFTTVLLVRSGDVEVNPGPNETVPNSVPDSTLLDIAKEIPDSKMFDLGIKLGFGVNALKRYRATNTIMGGAVNWEGTLYMLVDWRDDTTMEQQEELLRNALVTSSLQAIAQQYLPEDCRSTSVVPNVPIQLATARRQAVPLEVSSIDSHITSQQMTHTGQETIANSIHNTDYATSRAYEGPDSSRHQEGYFSQRMTNPVHEPTANSSGMYYNQSHDTAYAASRAYQGPDSSTYHGPNQYRPPLATIPLQGGLPLSHQIEPGVRQSHGPQMTSIQPNDLSLYLSGQLPPHTSEQLSNLHTGAGNAPFYTHTVSSHLGVPNSLPLQPNTGETSGQSRLTISNNNLPSGQLASIGGASCQSIPHTDSGAGALPTTSQWMLNTNQNTQSTPTVSSNSGMLLAQNSTPSSYPWQPNPWKPPRQSLSTISTNDPSAEQLSLRGGTSYQSCTHTDAGELPMMIQQERVQNNSPHINIQGSMSTSNSPQESPGPNMSRILVTNSPSSEQTVSHRMIAAQPQHPHIDDTGASQIRAWSGTPDTVPSTLLADQCAPGTSSYQTPHNSSVAHPIALDLHEGYTPVTSRANSLNKRTVSGTHVQPTLTMDSTSSSSNISLTMPSTSGQASTFVPSKSPVPSTKCNTPITESQLDECIADIKDSYRVHLCQISTSPLDSNSVVELQSIFTNLSLLQEDRNGKKKIPLKYEDLLTVDINGKPARCIMIQGEAGVGKTTFCAKIAWDWVTGECYQDYTLVAVVPLRDAKNGKTVGQVLKTYLPDDNDVTSEQLDEYIRTNQHKVLTVFDGFDEFCVEMSNAENQIVQILKGEKHTSGRVIVTTRPWKAHEIADGMNLKKQYVFVKIEGFTRKNVKTYVTKFYRDDKTSAQTLLEFMQKGSLITEAMAPFPIFCSMLCHMWKEEERREVIRTVQTFSQLFQVMVIHLKKHDISKQATTLDNRLIKDIEEEIDGHFIKIGKIAFHGLLTNKLAFLEQEYESFVEELRVACRVGLLTREKTMSNQAHGAVRKVARLDFTYSFPHKLFQEYTAAIHLQDLFNSNHDEFDRIMRDIILPNAPEYKYLLYFTGSFDKIIANDILTRLIECKVGRELIVEVAFEGYSEDAASIIEDKCQDMHHSLTIEKGTSLHVIASYMFALNRLGSLYIKRIPQSKILSRNLAEKVCSLQTLKDLRLADCNIPVSFSDSLLRHCADVMVETFFLDEVSVTKNSSINLAKCICFLPQLKNCRFHTKSGLSDDFCAVMQSEASQSQVESLEIITDRDESFISASAAQNLVASMCAMPFLKNVKLPGYHSDGFYNALGEKAASLKVESLELYVGDISVHGSQSLGASICAMPCLRNVNVSSNYGGAASKVTLMKDIHKGGASSTEVISSTCQIKISLPGELLIAFVSSLASSQTPSVQVESLEIHASHISESASQNLGASICFMQCLQNVKLHVSGELLDGFYIALGEGASSLKVESLEIRCRNHISGSASQKLCASICAMPFLRSIKLSVNLSDGFYNALIEGASSLKIEQMHLMGASCNSSHLSTIALLPTLKSLTLFDIKINDNRKHTEEEGSDPSDTHSSASLTELNVDEDSFLSLYGIGLLKRFPRIQKRTLAFHGRMTPFSQQLLHHVTMPDVTDLSLHGYQDTLEEIPELYMVALEPFPNLINLSLINIYIGNDACTTILNSLRNKETLKTISIKDCCTDAGLDPLCNEINAEGKMTVTVKHGECKIDDLGAIFKDL